MLGGMSEPVIVTVIAAVGLLLLAAAWHLRGYRVGRLSRILLSSASLLALFLTGVGLIMSAALKNDNLAEKLLSYDPRYLLAMDGFHILQDFKYPFK
jgi:hypothetical protein